MKVSWNPLKEYGRTHGGCIYIRLDGCCRLIDYVPPIDKLMWYFTRLYPPTLRLQDIDLPS